ncbi:MAG: hypothetical protein IPO32_01940 [Crocinitomicaceae bacterium]|jgi:predicted aspartyl protease|nr:hypothetical protein [Crocinitomicaceae bacterium]MBK6951494.1 hypothetical protein [Crocinitomicaceae bacterium]MBK9590291.1 hypothetical protein [Crocinitomicaceae bacterium]
MSKHKAALLEKEGPHIGIYVLPPVAILDQIKLAGETPQGRHLRAIIDTGAESSSISIQTLTELNLVPHNLRPRISTDGKIDHPVYDVIIQILFPENPDPINFHLEVAGLNLDKYGIYALLGRDVLRLCKLSYDGVKGDYKLQFAGEQKSEK